MTRPIFEPTPSRTDAVLGFGSDQLFRRPAPPIANIVPWIRLKQLNISQSFGTYDTSTLIYDDVCNPYPDYFSEYIQGTEIWGVNFFLPGLYQATCRVNPLVLPDSGFEITFYNVDWDTFGTYSNFIPGGVSPAVTNGIPINTSVTGYAEVTFRASLDDFSAADWQFKVIVSSFADAFDLYLGNYLEVRYLGGDPEFPDGLDNSNAECGT